MGTMRNDTPAAGAWQLAGTETKGAGSGPELPAAPPIDPATSVGACKSFERHANIQRKLAACGANICP